MKVNSAQSGFWKATIVVLVLLIILVLVIGAFVVTMDSVIPGDFNYPVKIAVEQIRLGSNELNFKGRAVIYTDLANNRSAEIELLIKNNKYKYLTETIDQMIFMQDRAIASIGSAMGKAENVSVEIQQLSESINRQINLLDTILVQVPASEYELINQQIVLVLDNQEKLEVLMDNNH